MNFYAYLYPQREMTHCLLVCGGAHGVKWKVLSRGCEWIAYSMFLVLHVSLKKVRY